MKHKFKEGDIVRHAATKENTGIRMVIVGIGYFKDATGETNTYMCSAERETFGRPFEGCHFKSMLQENELILCEQ